jgi:hypothetical protein
MDHGHFAALLAQKRAQSLQVGEVLRHLGLADGNERGSRRRAWVLAP